MTGFGPIYVSADLEPDPPDSNGYVDPLEHILSTVLLWKDFNHPGRLALLQRRIICIAGLYYLTDDDINQLEYTYNGQSHILQGVHKVYLRHVK